MPAEQLVELEIVVRGVVLAVPPEPVTALGDEQLLKGLFPVLRTRAARHATEHLTRLATLPPAPQVVAMADPDEKVAVDPGAWKDAVHRTRRTCGGFAHRDGSKRRMPIEHPVQRAQERA